MKVTKKNDSKFRTECILLVLSNMGFIINDTKRNGNYKINGVNNSIELMFYENAGSVCYSVFCRFQTPIAGLGNPYSGKHNFYSSSDVDTAIKEFETFLNNSLKAIV